MRSELESARSALDAAIEAVRQANANLDAEINGTGGSGTDGDGPRAAERRRELTAATEQEKLARTAVSNAERTLAEAQQSIVPDQDRRIKAEQERIDRRKGLIDREVALRKISQQDHAVAIARWVLTALVSLVDLAPLLLKMCTPRTLHDRVLRTHVARRFAVAEEVIAEDIAADVDVAAYARMRRVQAQKALIDKRFGSGDRVSDPAIPDSPSSPDRDGENQAPLSEQSTRPANAVGPPDSDGPSLGSARIVVDAHNILGEAGDGIDRYVGGRWRIGAQLSNADPALAWRTPYLAEDVFQRYTGVAALKNIHPPNKARGAIEAQQEVSSLPHNVEISPYVAPLLDGGYDADFGWFVVTPYYRKLTLQKRMEHEPMTLRTALAITEQVLEGLLAAFTYENRLLLHFDIKPSNIAFDDDGHVRIIDWGLSDVMNPDYRLSIDLTSGYTMWYAPPEQVLAEPGSNTAWKSPRCDIRAVGAVLYAMMTGRPPLFLEASSAGLLDGDGNIDRSNEAEFHQLLAGTLPEPLEAFFPSMGRTAAFRRLSDLVQRWLHPDPSRRVDDDGTQPAQENAVRALRDVVAEMHAEAPHLLAREVGAARVKIPRRRSGGFDGAAPRHAPATWADDQYTTVRPPSPEPAELGSVS
ncbi:hypothetical protein GCM10009557_12320 [Virgisporangium ochraceum]